MRPTDHDRIRQQYRRGCVFCAPDPALVLASGPRFGVLFDVSPLTPGHLVIHSHDHHGCAGEIPREHLDELDGVRAKAVDLVRQRYGAATLYEHGRAGHCLSDGPDHRLCHHFHLHVVPGDLDVTPRLAERFDRVPMDRYTDIADLYERHGDYLFVETDAGAQHYYPVTTAIERHLLRTLIAEQLGRPERADWRAHSDLDLLRAGMARLRPLTAGALR